MTKLLILGALCLLLISVGCAHPYRSGYSTRERWFYTNRSDGLVMREVWKDVEKGGGTFLCMDPSVANGVAFHTNQTDLGGGSYIGTGQLSVTVDPQTGQIISAGGTAIGNVIGAAVRSSAGLP